MESCPAMTRRAMVRLVAAGGATFLLAACRPALGATQAVATPLPVTIDYMHYGAGAQAQARAEAAKKFMATAPNITVNVTAIAPSSAMLEKFQATAAGGTPPDLLTLQTAWYGDLVAANMLAALDTLVKTNGTGFSLDAFYPESLAALQAGGKLYGIPRFIVTSVLFYNKDIFHRLGVTPPTDGWTWSGDFLAAAQKLTQTVAGQQTYATYFAPDDLRSTLVYAWGGAYFDPGGKSCTIDQPKAVDGLQFAADLRWKSHVATTPDVEKTAASQDLFLAQRVAIYPSQNYAYGNVSGAKFQIGAALVPQGPTGRKQYGSTTAYAIAAGSKAKEGAWEFLKWLVSDTGQQYLVDTETITPATKKAYQSPSVPPEIWNVFVAANKTAVYYPTVQHFTEAMKAVNTELAQSLDMNKRSVPDSARAAASAANAILKQ